ncbi:MAG: hypothetical protein ACE5HV_15055, partial [Acidobacteriota bacterium]
MSRIVRPLVSPTGRIVALSGATLWLLAAMIFSPAPEAAAGAGELGVDTLLRVEQVAGLDGPLYDAIILTTSPSGSLYLSDTGNSRVIEARAEPASGELRVVAGEEATLP